MNLPDVQNTKPKHTIYLPEVGINKLKLPITILQKNNSFQSTVADISINVDLKPDIKGISMSRLIEICHNYADKQIIIEDLVDLSKTVKTLCDSNKSHIIYSFPYFIKKKAPVSLLEGFVHHDVSFEVYNDKEKINKFIEVTVLATSLCPCSKEISDKSAHNQKCYIKAKIETDDFIWIEDLIEILENCASSPIYSIIKRPDEKYVTEYAYKNPVFVEDVARNAYTKLIENKSIKKFKVTITSDESIHVHQAVAIAQFG